MSLFLDNNVLIGYIFETDNWNAKSSKVMNCDSKKFSSNTVRAECNNIYDKIIRLIKIEFQKTLAEMNKSKSIEFKKISTFVESFHSKDIIMTYINNNIQKGKRTLMKGLRNLLSGMELCCLRNLQNLGNLLTFCTRDKPYKEIYQIFENDGLSKIDLFDVEIIIDAHHVGLQVKDLVLITGDYEHIIKRCNLIKDNTSLIDVIGLGEFDL